MTALDKMLSDLIALPSVNPAFLPPKSPYAGEHRVADFLKSTATRAGLEASLESVLPRRENVIIRLLPRGKTRQRIVLAPHMDTVGAAQISKELFQPRSVRGRLHGRGACDTKGCVAAMFTALLALAKDRSRPAQTEIVLAAMVDEENGQAGSHAFIRANWKADLAIVGEPTRLEVVTAHKGDLWLELETRGKSAHGARPELGRNAVHAMSRIVHVLETRYAAQLRRRKHPLLGHPTINVGMIAGGTQPNVVPAQCRIRVDRRTLPDETEKSVRREIQMILREEKLNANILNIRGIPSPALETDPSLPLVQHFMRSVGRRQSRGVHFYCDAAVLAAGGIPSIVYGPGDIAQAHTEDEWISLQSLERGAQQLLRFLRSLP